MICALPVGQGPIVPFQGKAKIDKISADRASAKRLTKEEASVAAKAALIDRDQAWWWLESWQKRELEADEDIHTGRVNGPFESVEGLIKDLRS